jgi:hypothetical protein
MKSSIVLQAAGLALVLLGPSAAFAQDAMPPPPSVAAAAPRRDPQQRAAIEATHAQLQRLEQQARSQILASLSPQHRAAFATIVGQYAIAPVQDRVATAKQLDALLTAGEARSILATESNERTAARVLMQEARAKVEASMTADQRAAQAARMQKMEAMHGSMPHPAPDAGMALLHVAFGGSHMHGGGPPGAP